MTPPIIGGVQTCTKRRMVRLALGVLVACATGGAARRKSIAFRLGSVNAHLDENEVWVTDPDGEGPDRIWTDEVVVDAADRSPYQATVSGTKGDGRLHSTRQGYCAKIYGTYPPRSVLRTSTILSP